MNIYAAIPIAMGGYGLNSGTSMSSPHSVGSAALVRKVHPTWTVSETKSALMMSAFNGGTKEDGTTPWDADDVGNGRLDLTKAALAGLVMDETTQHYIDANPNTGGDPKTLNVPSVRNMDCTPNCTWTRTVRNTLTSATNWTATGTAITPGFTIDVQPPNFSFTGGLGETQELTISATPNTNLTSAVAFGEVVLSPSGANGPLGVIAVPDARITVAIMGESGGPTPTPTPSCTPITTNEGFDDINNLVPNGWFMQNNSQPIGATGWFQGNPDVFTSQSGAPNSYIGANFNNGAGLATISNWLLTPPLVLQDGATLTFYTRTTDVGPQLFPDRLQVRMSTNGASTDVGNTATSVGDFTNLLLDINPTYGDNYPHVWTQFTVNLSGIPGGSTLGRLAFRYFVENGGPSGVNSDYIGIDTMSYANVCPGPTPTPTPTATPTATPPPTPTPTPIGTPTPTPPPTPTPTPSGTPTPTPSPNRAASADSRA